MRPLSDVTINVRFKLMALWTSVMFCYIYADYFDLYTKGSIQQLVRGQMGPLGPATPGVLVGASVLLAIPSVMIFLSLVFPPNVARWLSLVVGTLYTLVNCTNFLSSRPFYVFYGVVEVVLTLLVVWYAWRWPTSSATTDR
ncbi:MAG TPA: DUF6326 family protein [Candidatus Baltobacteraceae bacterium]|nr:DUF6326 family protein [Candidatus Baltobacteraceae bacterium]